MDFKVRILGSSSALPTSERFPTAQTVLYNNVPYLIDCAEGTQVQLRKYKVPFGRLKNIFISHLHGDHIYGIFGLLSSFNLLGRKQALNIYAPEKLKEIYETVLNLNNDVLKYKINFYPLNNKSKNKIFENRYLEVYSFPLIHSKEVYGFLFQEKQKDRNVIKSKIADYNLSVKQILELKKGKNITLDNKPIKNQDLTIDPDKPRSYAFCTDTLPLDNLDKYIKGVNLLYHEATFGSELESLSKQTFHSTAGQAAEIAKIVKADKLIIGHFSSRYKSVEPLLSEAKRVFQNTIEATDGLLVDVLNENC